MQVTYSSHGGLRVITVTVKSTMYRPVWVSRLHPDLEVMYQTDSSCLVCHGDCSRRYQVLG